MKKLPLGSFHHFSGLIRIIAHIVPLSPFVARWLQSRSLLCCVQMSLIAMFSGFTPQETNI